MNLALPALVIILGLLPGICCFYGYFAGRFDKGQAGVPGVEALALYVVAAIPIDAAALFACRWFGVDLDFGIATRLLSGTVADANISSVADTFRRGSYIAAFTYTVVLVSSFLVGSLLRRIVWSFRLDTVFSVLQLRHRWFYILQGRMREMPRVVLAYVDVLTEHPDGSRLYRGLVVDFELAATGALDSLTLGQARRGRGRGAEFQWIPIPSNRLTLMGSKIHSINVTYMTIENQKRRGPLGKLRRWWRSFVYQEP